MMFINSCMYDVYVTDCELYYYEFSIFYIYNVNNIPMLNGTNFKKWKEHVVIVLGCMDLQVNIFVQRLNINVCARYLM